MHAKALLFASEWRSALGVVLYGALLLTAIAGCAAAPVAPHSENKPTYSVATAVVSAVEQKGVPVNTSVQTKPLEGAGFIAVLLPGKSKVMRPAVDAIKAGVLAAATANGNAELPVVKVFNTDDVPAEVFEQFQRLHDQGALAVIGPLTKPSINYLADIGDFDIPVIALNSFDERTLRRAHLYSFSLSIEQEAQQVARQMFDEGLRMPLVLQGDSPLSARMVQGFVDSWKEINSVLPKVFMLKDARSQAQDLRNQLKDGEHDSVFFAANARQTRLSRPFIGNERPVFATSQINPGHLSKMAMVDMSGIRYLETPWILQPDNSEYALLNRIRSPSNDVERLFALGVDAWKLAILLSSKAEINFDGLSGHISMGSGGLIERELVLNSFNSGDDRPAVNPAP
jgi:outer membrane PBP1 activator LpoA protein